MKNINVLHNLLAQQQGITGKGHMLLTVKPCMLHIRLRAEGTRCQSITLYTVDALPQLCELVELSSLTPAQRGTVRCVCRCSQMMCLITRAGSRLTCSSAAAYYEGALAYTFSGFLRSKYSFFHLISFSVCIC